MKMRSIVWAVPALALLPTMGHAASTLETVKARGNLECGVSIGLPGFSYADEKGVWRGQDVDVCRALAAAVFGDAEKVKYTPTTVQQRWPVLQSGQVDVLSRNTTYTLSREATLGVTWAGINYYEGQTFMVKKSANVKKIADLNSSTVCVASGSTEESNVNSYFSAHGYTLKVLSFEKNDDAVSAFDAGRCDSYTAGSGALAGWRLKLKTPEEAIILKELISNDPQGPVVRNGDNNWADIVRWTLNTMIEAERLGITSKNVDEVKKESKVAEVRKMLGVEGDLGKGLGLSNDWAYNIIKQVGNYGESYERTLGQDSPFKLDRGLQQLWTKGGLLFSPSFE